MTKFYFIAGLALAAMSCTTTPKTVVSVHVEGTEMNAQPALMMQDTTYSAALDSTRSVSFTLAENGKAECSINDTNYITTAGAVDYNGLKTFVDNEIQKYLNNKGV